MTLDVTPEKAQTGFRHKIVRSVQLAGVRFMSEVGLRLVSTVVLTRLLAPETYGVFALVLVYLYLLEMVSDVGIRSLILTREGEVSDGFLQTCWTLSILRGLAIALFSFIIAATIGALQAAEFFAADNAYAAGTLPWAIASLGAVAFVVGFSSPMVFMYERNMDFSVLTATAVLIDVLALIVTIALAFYLRSIWALVLGAAVKAVLQVIVSFAAFKGPPMRLNLNRHDVGVVIDRGKWIMGHSILHAVSQSADRLVLGFVMTSSTFGFYFIARQIIDIARKFLISLDAQIGMQVFTHLQKSTAAEFRRNYYRYRLFFDACTGVGVGMLIVLAPVLVQIVFDDRYQGAAPIVQTLAWGILLIGPLLLRSAFSAQRLFKEMTYLSVLSAVTLWAGLLAAVFILENVEIALIVIALHRLPEAMVLMLWGGDRDWVIVWREFANFFFCGIGLVLGQGILILWELMV